jgi:hypothetical protein
MTRPDGLGDAGAALWAAIPGDVPAGWELDARGVAVLGAACRQADLVADLEAAVERDGLMIEGAAGQRRLNGAVTELRQARVAMARLLGDVKLPDEDGKATSAASERARHAAQARWSRTITRAERERALRHG